MHQAIKNHGHLSATGISVFQSLPRKSPSSSLSRTRAHLPYSFHQLNNNPEIIVIFTIDFKGLSPDGIFNTLYMPHYYSLGLIPPKRHTQFAKPGGMNPNE